MNTKQTVHVKAARLYWEMMCAIGLACVFMGMSIEHWRDGERTVAFIFGGTVLPVVWWMQSQLAAVCRLIRYNGALVMDAQGITHFSMGFLAWHTVLGLEVIEIERSNENDKSLETLLVIGVSKDVFDRISPSFLSGLALSRYARFRDSTSSIELSCDFLKTEPRRLLWHARQRADALGGQRLSDWSAKESIDAALRRRSRMQASKLSTASEQLPLEK